MAQKIRITAGNAHLEGQLNDSKTAKAIEPLLPVEGSCVRWGGEIFFGIPLSAEQEPDSSPVVELGALAFGPSSGLFCMFFGPTPVSDGDEPRAANPVNVVGRMTGDLSPLEDVSSGTRIKVEAV